MKESKLFSKISKDLSLYQSERSQIGRTSSSILTKSKQAIFSAHEGNLKEAEENLKIAKDSLTELNKKYNKSNRLQSEGMYKDCVEEYLEARLFVDILNGKNIDIQKGFNFNPEEYLGALSDMTGELVRQCVLKGNVENLNLIKKYREITKDVIGFMLKLYMTGKIRMKFDQAKSNLKRIESMIYEINLSTRK